MSKMTDVERVIEKTKEMNSEENSDLHFLFDFPLFSNDKSVFASI